MTVVGLFSSHPAPEWTHFESTWQRPQPPSTATVEENRDAANARTATLFADVLGRPSTGFDVVDLVTSTTGGCDIHMRLYRPHRNGHSQSNPLPLYISFHGGGFHLGTLDTEDPHCRQIALKTGFAVLNVEYRHTPEYKFPAPVDDAWSAFQWAVRNASTHGLDRDLVFCGGVSAGGTLALAVALMALQQHFMPQVKGIVLGTPSTVHPDHFPIDMLQGKPGSWETNAEAPFLNAAKLRSFTKLYEPEPTHFSVSPLLLASDSFVGLCPVSFHIAGLDPLRDEGLLLEEKLKAASVKTTLHLYPGVPHAFMGFPMLPSAERWRASMQKDLMEWVGL